MTHGSLFSGIGGFDLAAEWAGWENKFHCEWNEFGQRVLKYYWPHAVSYGDITKTDFTVWRGRIDVLTGGFPCQPYSVAGKRKGKEDERHLWPEMLRAIQEIQPTYIVGENVPGLINWNGGLVFEEVQADLEAQGYEVIPFILPAASVNAPHKRERIWFVAYSESRRTGRLRDKVGEERTCSCNELLGECCGILRESSITPHPHGSGFQEARAKQQAAGVTGSGLQRDATDASNSGLQGSKNKRGIDESREERKKQFAGHFQPTWENFPTQSPICNGDDGLSSRLAGITFPKFRNESIKAGGNAIVPQVAFQIFKAINEFESINF